MKESIMRKSTLIMSAISLAVALSIGSAYAEEVIYGAQLMTNQERIEFRNKMRNAKSAEEQERIRLEHHKAMQERAKAQGKSLPDMAPAAGGGLGPSGGGMGPGSGRNR
jgi:hypothetical protein